MSALQVETGLGASPVNPGNGIYRPLGLGEIELTDGFWAQRQELNGTVSINHCDRWVERMGWVRNFTDTANGVNPGRRTGKEFSDSDVYKLIEAMAWEVGRTGDERLDSRAEELGFMVAAAQHTDGYLNTHFGGAGQRPRYSDLEWGHELYSYGHLIQAAVARLRTGRCDALVFAAERAADHICEVFGPSGREGVCGHPEIESALVEFYRTTGKSNYLRQARLFVERRGRRLLGPVEFGPSYFQDDTPVREASVLRGHAVRALYLAAGAIDVAVEDNDIAMLNAVKSQYLNTLSKRTYLTGGMGSRHQDEAFGDDYELPPDRAYAETCAAVASVMVAWRLLLATAEERWADVIERTLYNAVAVSPSHDGRAFFYANSLHQRVPGDLPAPDAVSSRAASRMRAPWFEVSCCPSNVARLYASLGTYFASANDHGVQLHQYGSYRIATSLGDGRQVALDVRGDYPFDGQIEVEILDAPGGEWELGLRIPGWAAHSARLNGQPVTESLARLRGGLRKGTVLHLSLPVDARMIKPHPRIDAVRGCLAVERGPLVLCAESTDLPDGTAIDDIRIDPAGELMTTATGAVVTGCVAPTAGSEGWPYTPIFAPDHVSGAAETDPTGSNPDGGLPGQGVTPQPITLIPYCAWGNRGPSSMRIWIPEAAA